MTMKIFIDIESIPKCLLPFGYNARDTFHLEGDTLKKKIWSREPYFRHYTTQSCDNYEERNKFEYLLGLMQEVKNCCLIVENDNNGDFMYAKLEF